MFDLSSSKLLLLAVIALIVVGPKDLPVLLRTVGRYIGMIRRQAGDFRTQFEDAMRDSELTDLKKEVEQLGEQTTQTLRDATNSIETKLDEVSREVETAGETKSESLDATDPAALAAAESAIQRTDLADPGIIEPPAALQPPVPAEPPAPAPAKPVATAPSDPVPSRTGA